MNTLRKNDMLSKPSSAGRVSGKGCSTKWSDYYSSARKEKGLGKQAEAQLQEKMAEIPCIVEQQVGQALNNMMPSLFVMMRDWLASGQHGLPPMPSFTGQQLSQLDGGGRSGVSGGSCAGVPGGGCVGVPGCGRVGD